MMLQYLVLVKNALLGMKHLNRLDTVKYKFQNNPKNDSSANITSIMTRPMLSPYV